jgi:ubiquinone/menaquinone biosynthesis C-methylase UbiE
MVRPATIDNRWDILYREYPEAYDAFASIPHEPNTLRWLTDTVPLTGKTVVDVGAGTGKSTFQLAQAAQTVIGVEPEEAMRQVAITNAERLAVANVQFVAGNIHSLPLEDHSVDAVVAMTTTFYPPTEVIAFTHEAERVLRPTGWLVISEIAPGWYGGELEEVIGHPVPEIAEKDRILRADLGFMFKDWDIIHDYGTADNAIRIYGFIFGPKAIAYLEQTGRTTIRFRMRGYFRQTLVVGNGTSAYQSEGGHSQTI